MAGALFLIDATGDKRKRPLMLASKGARQLERIHRYSNGQVDGALGLLSDEERACVVRGMQLYARALGRLRAREQYQIRPIARKDDPDVARIIHMVMPEYGASGPGFALHDPEVQAMSEAYSRERAGYFMLIHKGERVVGGGGFALLEGGQRDVCELRKMYFLPEARGTGMGRELLSRILAAAKSAGYRTCYLETLESMAQARRLYRAAGFEPLAKPMGATGHFGCNAWYAKKL